MMKETQGKKVRPKWTDTHLHNMQDGWFVDKQTLKKHLFPLYMCPITNHGG
jgi:hypothetical protein